jgi:DNA-binding PadR family transcriptional regulator
MTDTTETARTENATTEAIVDETVPGLPRKFLRPFLLLALANDDTAHGYELCEAVRARGLAVDLAGVYRDLRTMEQHDLVTSSWEPSGVGPDRRVYELTFDGRREARVALRELQEVRDGLSAALSSFSATAKPTS